MMLGFWYLMYVTCYILAKWTAVGVPSTQAVCAELYKYRAPCIFSFPLGDDDGCRRNCRLDTKPDRAALFIARADLEADPSGSWMRGLWCVPDKRAEGQDSRKFVRQLTTCMRPPH